MPLYGISASWLRPKRRTGATQFVLPSASCSTTAATMMRLSLPSLLPYEPRQDLAALLTGLVIGAIWRYGDRFRDSMRGRFSS